MTAIIDIDTPKVLPEDVQRAMATTCSALVAQKRAESLEILEMMHSYIQSGGMVTVVHLGASGIVIAPPAKKMTREENRAAIAARDWDSKTRAERMAAARKVGAAKRKKQATNGSCKDGKKG